MPLYKKTTSKAKVKTQSSFISPLLSQTSTQNKIKDLLKDDYKENLPIPIKKRLLEPLINTISNDVDLIDKLPRRSFKDSSKTLIEVSKTKETWSGKKLNIPQKLKKTDTAKTIDIPSDVGWANKANKEASIKDKVNKSTKYSTKRAKSKELSRTLSDLTSQSPLLFNSSPRPSIQNSNKRLKTENSMTITTKIEISSNTDGDIFNIKSTPDTPNFQLSDVLNDCVVNNLRMTQQLLKPDKFSGVNNMKTTINTDDTHAVDKTALDSKMEDENELDSSLRDILDDVVNTNIVLSQKMMNDDGSIKKFQTDTKKGDEKLETTKSKRKVNGKKKAGNKSKENMQVDKSMHSDDDLDASLRSLLDDVVNTNIMLSQKMDDDQLFESTDLETKDKKSNKQKLKNKAEKSKVKTKAELKQVCRKSKDTITASKSKDKGKPISKSQEVENKISGDTIKTFNRLLRVMKSDESVEELEQLVNSKKDFNKEKNKTGKILKDNIKNKYLIEKQKATKVTKEKSMNNNTNLQKNKKNNEKKMDATDLNTEGKGLGDKKLKKKKETASCPPKPRNMIFTSKNPKINEMDLIKLLELQEERDVGLYVYCDTCDKVRYLPQCKDPLELPAKWYCHMNPDSNYNKCSDPDFEIEPEKEDIIIHNKYNAGSIVWAKMDGYPWWPAMVDDDPNLTDYFWLDEENSVTPSWYHVTFFDSSEVTRAWIRTHNLAPFEINAKNPMYKPKKYDCYRHRLDVAAREAKTALKMGILERLRTYGFVVRYFKKINGTEKRKKKGKNKINAAKNTDNLDDVTDDAYDNLSISSSEIISDILKPKKSGENKVASDEEILESIDLNHFICNEEAFDEL